MEADEGRRRGAARWLLALLLMGALLRLFGLVQPWNGSDFHSAFAAHGTGPLAANFARHGFTESGGMPYMWRLELADGRVLHSWYNHHPALYSVLCGVSVKVFGIHQWALHLPALILSLLSLLACHGLARQLMGTGPARVAAAFFAALPMGAFYGVLPWTEVPIVGVHLLLLGQYLAWLRSGRGRHAWLSLAWIVAGGLLDWQAALILPGLALHLLLRGFRERRTAGLKFLVGMVIASLLPVGLHWLHLRLVVPEEITARDTEHTLAFIAGLSVPLSRFLELQVGYIVRWYTLPVSILLAAGFLMQLWLGARRRLGGDLELLLVMPWPALLYVALVPGRSLNHDFFWYLLLPWACLTLGWLYGLVRARLWWRGIPLVSVPAIVTAVLIGTCAWQSAATWRDGRSERVEALRARPWARALADDSGTVVLTTTGIWQIMAFESRGPVIANVNDVAALRGWRGRLGRLPRGRRVMFVYDLAYLLPERQIPALLDLHRELVRLAPETLHTELAVEHRVGVGIFDLTAWARR